MKIATPVNAVESLLGQRRLKPIKRPRRLIKKNEKIGQTPEWPYILR